MIESVLIITSMSLLMNNIITYNKQALRSQVFNIWQINFKVVNNLFNYLPKKKKKNSQKQYQMHKSDRTAHDHGWCVSMLVKRLITIIYLNNK